VQPLLVHRAREAEDFTRNKNDSDAMIIARLVTKLRCYLPSGPRRAGPVCGTWAPAGPGWSATRARLASRSVTCSSAPGRRRWARLPSMSAAGTAGSSTSAAGSQRSPFSTDVP
jgi:hypothetical protein